MVRIGLDALLMGGGEGVRRTGISRYESELSSALLRADSGDEFHLYTQSMPAESSASGVWRLPPFPVANPAVRLAWEHTGMVAQARRDRLDLLHGMAFVVPPAWRKPSVVTVHDLAFLKMEGHAPRRRTVYLRTLIGQSVRRARRVLTISEHTKNDVVELFDIDPAKIVVTPLGVSPRLKPLDHEARTQFRAAHQLTRPTLLYVGTLEPRKNIPNLLRAFEIVASRTDAELVLGGAEGWLTDELHQTLSAMKARDRVRLTGFIPEAELGSWLSAADLFVFPSRYEGFGLPPLEAMACGTPVVSSTSSSLPEVLGDDALLADPDDIGAIAAAIERILTDPALSADLSKRGVEWAARFTWHETARLTLEAYRTAI
jgi:glycosyltransferase involved in cell wall biosynthesis